MALTVVEFEGVTRERLESRTAKWKEAARRRLPPAEFVMLHDAAGEKSLVFFSRRRRIRRPTRS